MPAFSNYQISITATTALLWAVLGVNSTVCGQDSQNRALNETVVQIRDSRKTVEITERFAKVVELGRRITHVDGFDPNVIDVTALTPNRVRVLAVHPGITTMILRDETGQSFSVGVFVTGDARHLQAHLDHLFPHAAVTAVKMGEESVVLRGWVTEPQNIPHMEEVAEEFFADVLNQLKVGGVQMVTMKVKIMEVQRSKLRRLGLNFEFTGDGLLDVTPGGVEAVADIAARVVNTGEVLDVFLDALREEQLLKIKSEPILTGMNGRPASLLSGGEFPLPVPGAIGTVTVEWREFGTRLEAVPIILGGGRLRLELQTEVSERDFSNAINIGSFVIPAITSRRANTQVELKFGETVVIAGLITRRQTSSTTKIPFLGELPWIGAAFRSVQFDDDETELLILVTPEYVGPLEHDQLPPGGPGDFSGTPTDRELFFGAMLEVPRYGDECDGCEPLTDAYHQSDDGTLAPIPAAPAELDAAGETFLAPPAPAASENNLTGLFRRTPRGVRSTARRSSPTKRTVRKAGFRRAHRNNRKSASSSSPTLTETPVAGTTKVIPTSATVSKNWSKTRTSRPGLIEPAVEPLKPPIVPLTP